MKYEMNTPIQEMSQEEVVRDLHTRFSRVERAIMGDPTVGHIGLVTRVEKLERGAMNTARVFWIVLGSVTGGAALGGGSMWALLTGG